MENVKLKLANNILIEIEAIRECTNVSGGLVLAELLTSDALKLAEMIKDEEENNKLIERKAS